MPDGLVHFERPTIQTTVGIPSARALFTVCGRLRAQTSVTVYQFVSLVGFVFIRSLVTRTAWWAPVCDGCQFVQYQ
jgi:hypothetical protein